MNADPHRLRGLGDLLRQLRLAGLPIYPRDIERLQQACRAGVSTERQAFYALLRCTLAKNDQEQAILAEQFQLWWQGGAQWIDAIESAATTRTEEAPPSPEQPTVTTDTGRPRHAVAAPKSPAERWRERRSWRQRLIRLQRQGWTQLKRWWQGAQPYATLILIAVVGTAVALWRLRPEPEQPARPSLAVSRQTPAPPVGTDPGFQPVARYYSWIPQAVEVEGQDYSLPILFALLLACGPLGYLVWYRYKHASSLPPAAETAWAGPAWRPLLPQHEEHTLLRPDELLRGAWAVESFVAEEPTRRLDIPRTVAATSRAAGIPVLRFQHARYPKAVWLWRDREHEPPAARRLVEELHEGLTRLALPVQIADFWATPTELYNEAGKPFSPLDLEGRREQVWLFVITDGRRLPRRLNSALEGPALNNVLRALSLWPQLAFVDSGRGEFGLARTLAPFSIDCIAPEQLIARLSGRVSPPSDLTPQLRNALQSWQAAACLCPDPVPWDTARALLQALDLPGLSPWHFPALAARAAQVPGGLDWSQAERCQALDWLAHSQAFDPHDPSSTELARALRFWRDHYRQEIAQRRVREDDSLRPWSKSPAALRIRMELGLLALWDRPNQAARALYPLFTHPSFREQVQTRLGIYADQNGARTDNHGNPLIRLPWAWSELRGRTRRLLQDMGFTPPPGGRVAPRLSGGLVLAAAFLGGLLAVGGYWLGELLLLMAPVTADDRVYMDPVFGAQVIIETDRAGADTRLVVGSAKHLTLRTARPLQRFKVTWSGGWGGEAGTGYPNPVASDRAGGSIWYAGTLAQPIRGCERDWPRRSLVVLDTAADNPAAQQLAAVLLDKGSADKVLIGTGWDEALTGFQELPIDLTGPDQLILVTDRADRRPGFAGNFAIVRLDEMSEVRLRALLERLTFKDRAEQQAIAGVKVIEERWGKVEGVVGIDGREAKLRAGPGVSAPDPQSGLSFVRVCGGTFTMGSTKEQTRQYRTPDSKELSEIDRLLNQLYLSESPPHTVTLEAFDMTQTEITNAQYQRYRSDWQYEEGRANHPAVDLRWDQARSYCEGLGYRLPTEAEWEYAARGGSQTAWHFGDDEARLGGYGWYSENAKRQAQQVGSLKPNPVGLYDMAGNAWEWVADCYSENAYQARETRTSIAPFEKAGKCTYRVDRGGSAWFDARNLRSADRGRLRPEYRDENLGFRCVRAPAASD